MSAERLERGTAVPPAIELGCGTGVSPVLEQGREGPATTITLNDRPRTLNGDRTLSALVAELGLAERRGVAVAVNGAVVSRSGWSAHELREGDRVLVIRATQGG